MRNSYYVDTISMYDILMRNAPERCPAVDVVHRYFRVDRLTSPPYVHGLDRGILDIKKLRYHFYNQVQAKRLR